jgi:hypothetical protein
MRSVLLTVLAGVWLCGCGPTVSRPGQMFTPEHEAYRRAFSSSDPQVAEQFLAQYPNSVYASNVRDRLEVLKKQQQEASLYAPYQQRDTAAGYREFLAKYPESAFTENARLRIAELDPDGDFEPYRKRDTVEGYEEFLATRHTNHKYFSAALERIAALTGRSTIAKSPETIIVTAGPISQPYKVLGEVNVNTRGMINLGSALNDALFRSPLAVAAGGRTPVAHTEQMNKFLKEKAREQYGHKVDAIINATYKTDHDGDVFASGLAVHFTKQESPEPQRTIPSERRLEGRLKELKDLRERGLISAEEYYQKRQELLQGL